MSGPRAHAQALPSEVVAPPAPTPEAAPSTPIPLLAPTPQPAAPAPAPSAPASSSSKEEEAGPKVVVAAGKGLTVTSADEKNSLQIRARVQIRDTVTHDKYAEPDAAQNTNELQIRTLRLYVQGNVLSKDLKYLIQLALGAGDFEKDSNSPIFDAYVEYVKLRDLNVRIGQYFVPFDRARTIREFALQFVDRQQVVRELTLDRDVGLMFSSQDLFGLGSHLGYNVFVGGGDGRNRVTDLKNPFGPQRGSVLAIGRLVLKPFGAFDDYDQEADLARGKPRMGIGVAGGYNLHSDRSNSTFGSTYTAGTFNYTHLAADVSFKAKGFSLLAEYVKRQANRDTNTRFVDGKETTQYSRSGWGYFVQAGQMLTDRLEVTARWDELYADIGTDPDMRRLARDSGRQAGGGFNYYLNGHFFKLQADYFCILSRQNDAHDLEPRHAVRAQLDATF